MHGGDAARRPHRGRSSRGPRVPDGTPSELADAGEITIGVKIDQPGIGLLEPGADLPTGFDIEIGRILAAALGIDDDGITWKETISDNREPFLIKSGDVDIVIASYSITDERRADVGQAGPYYVTGQQLLVREEDAETITVTGGHGRHQGLLGRGVDLARHAPGRVRRQPVPLGTYSECVDQLDERNRRRGDHRRRDPRGLRG